MHPFDTDCSGLVYGFFDKDGNVIPMTGGIPAVTTIGDEQAEYTDPCIDDLYSGKYEITMNFRVRNHRGLCDFICGRTTPAAGRFVRSGKRDKEKRRRKKLKGETV